MKKFSLFLVLFLIFSCYLYGVNYNLAGYLYGSATAPVGDEWNNPQKIAYNKEQPHNCFFNFENIQQARKVLPENSAYWMNLNGTWKFRWAPDPDHRPSGFQNPKYNVSTWDDVKVPMSWNMYGIQKDGNQKYGVPIYVNTRLIFQYEKKVDDWRGGVMRTPPTNWTTYKYRNEVGSYRRIFTLPASWKNHQIIICFDGVDSFFYLWINGHYVGFSKNSRNAARFDITRFLKKGKNIVAVEVYRNSDGSFLEAQDMFRLPGIFRTVSLCCWPKVQIKDLRVLCDMDEDMDGGLLKVSADVFNMTNKNIRGYKIVYNLYANKLYSDENEPVKMIYDPACCPLISEQSKTTCKVNIYVDKPNIWSAEAPWRYTLVAELKNNKNKTVETLSTIVGFRKVSIRKVMASMDEFNLPGKYLYLNGTSPKLKGINRHETEPTLGHAITRDQMEKEIMLMKKANINHVRTSHYPDDPYWYYLCDKYGIYLEAEANIESHEYFYGKGSLSHPVEWRDIHVDRVLEMAHSYYNNPSIIMWSLGNEAGPGVNFKAAYDSLKAFDKSRPVEYERNNEYADIGACQYPSVEWVQEAAKGTKNIKYPFHIQEYAHSMGNACGNLANYWKAIESTNFICGGAIWDWVDQAMYNYDKTTGKRYMAYGGDFGDYPNDGQFVMNGIMFANLKPKPQYYEVKKVYQNIQIDSINGPMGYYTIFNKNYYTTLSDYTAHWILLKNGKETESGNLSLPVIKPRNRMTVKIPYNINNLDSNAEYFIKIQFLLKSDKPWAPKGYVQAEEQYLVKAATTHKIISNILTGGGIVQAKTENDSILTINGKDFNVKFNKLQGTIYSLSYGPNVIIPSGCGPRIDAFRAFLNNDNWAYHSWFNNGLHNLKNHVTSFKSAKNTDGSLSLTFDLISQAPYGSKLEGEASTAYHKVVDKKDQPFGKEDFMFVAKLKWTVYGDGSIKLESNLSSNKPETNLPRIGFVMETNKQFDSLTYYGRGPQDNYPDRKTGQMFGVYSTTIDSMLNIWPKPQDTGNREDVRWCSITDKSGNGARFIAPYHMSIEALPNSDMDLTLAGHPYQISLSKNNFLHLDAAVCGIGGNSCGPKPLKRDLLTAAPRIFTFLIRPITKNAIKPKD